jgi:hypothetical protein
VLLYKNHLTSSNQRSQLPRPTGPGVLRLHAVSVPPCAVRAALARGAALYCLSASADQANRLSEGTTMLQLLNSRHARIMQAALRSISPAVQRNYQIAAEHAASLIAVLTVGKLDGQQATRAHLTNHRGVDLETRRPYGSLVDVVRRR